MERQAGHPLSRRLNTQLFTVVGPSYVPERLGEPRHEGGWFRAPAAGRNRWLAIAAAAALILFAANIGNIVEATARSGGPAPLAQPAGLGPSIAIFGGSEPIRW